MRLFRRNVLLRRLSQAITGAAHDFMALCVTFIL